MLAARVLLMALIGGGALVLTLAITLVLTSKDWDGGD